MTSEQMRSVMRWVIYQWRRAQSFLNTGNYVRISLGEAAMIDRKDVIEDGLLLVAFTEQSIYNEAESGTRCSPGQDVKLACVRE